MLKFSLELLEDIKHLTITDIDKSIPCNGCIHDFKSCGHMGRGIDKDNFSPVLAILESCINYSKFEKWNEYLKDTIQTVEKIKDANNDIRFNEQ